tara:strand:+ start:309 stop:572 length:264 start_codon:yes stop_codon:yes gene_type:complete
MNELPNVIIYTTRFCPFCVRAKSLLNKKSVHFTEIRVDGDAALRREMMAKAGSTSVPQIWIDETHVGGCDELYAAERSGRLNQWLSQ